MSMLRLPTRAHENHLFPAGMKAAEQPYLLFTFHFYRLCAW